MGGKEFYLVTLLMMATWSGLSGKAVAETHLGQPIKEHVVLYADDPPTGQCGSVLKTVYRQQADGQRSQKPFFVPRGKLLVVTDTSWTAWIEGGRFVKGQVLRLLLLSQTAGQGVAMRQVYESKPVVVGIDDQVIHGGGEELTSGFPVGTSRTLCFTLASDGGFGAGLARVRRARLFGYLIDKNKT